MTQHHWKALLPVDRYYVKSHGIIHEYDRHVITLLYQPLIGAFATSLYMTLWSELEKNTLWGGESTHNHLMGVMHGDLKQIFHERKKLEGIGLLKTYRKEKEDVRQFIYELQPPLSPKQFFNDGVLNVYLYNRLGKSKFHKMKQYFSVETMETDGYEQVTHSFNEVFTSLSHSEMTPNRHSELARSLELDEGREYESYQPPTSIEIKHTDFDFDLLLAGISENMIPKHAITMKVKDAIAKLAYVYQISPLEMKQLVMKSLNVSTDTIDIELLRKEARNWYQIENGSELPSLAERQQPIIHRTMAAKQPETKEEKLIVYLENVSPYQFLKDISNGAEPARADMQIVEDTMFNQKLNPGVVNVLLHYIMLIRDMKLSKAYVEKLAGHWARKGIKTVQEAMDLAKEEHKKYKTWPESKKQRPINKKVIRKEMLPDWFQQDGNDNKQESVPADSSNGNEEERKKLEERLKKFKRQK